MRILISGTGGFIGGTLANRLQETDGCEVVALSRSAAPGGLASGMRWLQCELTQGIPFDESADYIVHCAAIQNYSDMPIKGFIESNLAMTENLAAYGRKVGVKGVIFASSLSLYGQIRDDIVDEHTNIINPSPYGISKYLSELVLQEYSAHFPSIALRLCGVVGKGMKNIWLARVLSAALRGESIDIHNASRPFNNILHLDDLLGFVLSLMKNGFSGFSAFPIASSLPMTIREIVSEIIAATDSLSEIVDNGVIDNSFLISNEYAISRFGYRPAEVASNVTKFVLSV